MSVVLHHGHPVAPRDLQNSVHLTAHARVVDRKDGLSALGDEPLQLCLVQVEGIGADVYKHGMRAPQHERIDGGDESESRHDDLIARLDVQQQRPRHAELLLQQCVALFC